MKTETDVQNLTRLAVQKAGGVAWRNNRGALKDARGIPVRFGLANDTSALDKVFKTGDLVGIGPGGVFCMWECKKPGWKWCGDERERAQWAAICFVRERGGRAGFITSPEMAVAIMHGVHMGAYSGT